MTDLDAKHYRSNSANQYNLAHEMLNGITLKGTESVLDVGCGDGRITAELALHLPQGSIVGIDPSASMIDLATQSFAHPNLEFKKMLAEEWNSPIDLALVMNSLHWIRNPKAALQSIATALKPAGRLFILTYPKESPYWQFLEKTLHDEAWACYASQSAWNTIFFSHEYKKIIEDAGLTIRQFSLQEKVARYRTLEDLADYIKGWLHCYLPLSQELEKSFLQKAVCNAESQSLSNSEIQLLYQTLTLEAIQQ